MHTDCLAVSTAANFKVQIFGTFFLIDSFVCFFIFEKLNSNRPVTKKKGFVG